MPIAATLLIIYFVLGALVNVGMVGRTIKVTPGSAVIAVILAVIQIVLVIALL